jgi:hypothetical protein
VLGFPHLQDRQHSLGEIRKAHAKQSIRWSTQHVIKSLTYHIIMQLSSALLLSIALLATSVTAAPLPDVPAEPKLEARFLSFLGKALRSAPNKAGKQIGKGQGEGGVSAKTVDTMTKNMGKYVGKEQDRKCVEGWANTLYRTGGANMVINCDKKKDASIFAQASSARANAFAMARKKGLMRRHLGEWDLEELD